MGYVIESEIGGVLFRSAISKLHGTGTAVS